MQREFPGSDLLVGRNHFALHRTKSPCRRRAQSGRCGKKKRHGDPDSKKHGKYPAPHGRVPTSAASWVTATIKIPPPAPAPESADPAAPLPFLNVDDDVRFT